MKTLQKKEKGNRNLPIQNYELVKWIQETKKKIFF